MGKAAQWARIECVSATAAVNAARNQTKQSSTVVLVLIPVSLPTSSCAFPFLFPSPLFFLASHFTLCWSAKPPSLISQRRSFDSCLTARVNQSIDYFHIWVIPAFTLFFYIFILQHNTLSSKLAFVCAVQLLSLLTRHRRHLHHQSLLHHTTSAIPNKARLFSLTLSLSI